MGRKPNNANSLFKPKPKIDADELNALEDSVLELECRDLEQMEIIYDKLKSLKSFFDSVEISNSKEYKPARDSMDALESKYKKLVGVEMEVIDANITYLRVQKKISKLDTIARDSMPYCDEAEMHYLHSVQVLVETMIDMQLDFILDLAKFEAMMNEIKRKAAKRK